MDLQGELHVCVSKAACRLGVCCLTRRGTASDMVCSCVRSALAIGWGLGQGALDSRLIDSRLKTQDS